MLSDREIDLVVARRIRTRRRLLEITQLELSLAIGVTYQQVQKYERAANRISASKLWRIARVLGVPVNHFFEGLDTHERVDEPKEGAESDGLYELLTRNVIAECVERLAAVKDQDIRNHVIPLVDRLSE